MQAIPLQQAAVLPYAGDDGGAMGQAYRMSLDLEHKQVTLAIRFPDEAGKWTRTWREKTMRRPLPELVIAQVKRGAVLAPSLRESIQAEQKRTIVISPFSTERRVPIEGS